MKTSYSVLSDQIKKGNEQNQQMSANLAEANKVRM